MPVNPDEGKLMEQPPLEDFGLRKTRYYGLLEMWEGCKLMIIFEAIF